MAIDSDFKNAGIPLDEIVRNTALRGSLDALGQSIGGLHKSRSLLSELVQRYPNLPEIMDSMPTEPVRDANPAPVPSAVRNSDPSPAPELGTPTQAVDPVQREIEKREHEAFILRRIFGEKRLSVEELKILIEVDAEIEALRQLLHAPDVPDT